MSKTANKFAPEVHELRQANEILRKGSAYFTQAEFDCLFRR